MKKFVAHLWKTNYKFHNHIIKNIKRPIKQTLTYQFIQL